MALENAYQLAESWWCSWGYSLHLNFENGEVLRAVKGQQSALDLLAGWDLWIALMFSLILTGILLKGEPPDHQHMNIISKDNAGFLKFSVKHAGVQETMTLCRKTPRCACQATSKSSVFLMQRVIWMLVFVHTHLQSFLPSCFTWALAGMWEARVFSASQWWGWHLHFCVFFSVSWSGGCKIETSVHSSCMLRHFIKQMPFRSKVLHCTRNINDSVRIHMQIQLQSAAAFLKINKKRMSPRASYA